MRRRDDPEPGQLPSALEDALDHHRQALQAHTAARHNGRHRDRDRRHHHIERRDHRIERDHWRDGPSRRYSIGPWVVDAHHRRRAREPDGTPPPPF